MSPASIVGFLMDLAFNPLFWSFIIFWIIYKVTKKNWVKITAIVLTIIGALTFISTIVSNFTNFLE